MFLFQILPLLVPESSTSFTSYVIAGHLRSFGMYSAKVAI